MQLWQISSLIASTEFSVKYSSITAVTICTVGVLVLLCYKFQPNYQSALWFIEHVFPLVRRSGPCAQLIIAGACPVPELEAKQNPGIRVTGAVADLGAEIASSQLYVVPMVYGSGFKNKVVEALANGTFVAGTSLAFEFLDFDLRKLMLVGDTPADLAHEIVAFLNAPYVFEKRLEQARRLAMERFD